MFFEPLKRQDILNAAFKLLAENSSDEITIYDILRKAGTTLATFYKYFDSKEAVINEVHFQLRLELDGQLSAVPPRRRKRPRTSARAVGQNGFDSG